MDIEKIPLREISIVDDDYPTPLLELVDPPKKLWIRGELPKNFDSAVAIVGSRKCSWYGVKNAKVFATAISKEKGIVVSGFMYGIDTVAHWACLDAKGITVAVLGNGLNVVYPKENHELYKEIIGQKGCLISEYSPDFEPQKWSFPQRNRIVAALAVSGTLVVEAQASSGSLITAKYAEMLGRDVMAIPGNIDQLNSEGTNKLIKEANAKMVTLPTDLETSKRYYLVAVSSDEILDPLCKLIMKLLMIVPSDFSILVKKTGFSVGEVTQSLKTLMTKKIISEYENKFFVNNQ